MNVSHQTLTALSEQFGHENLKFSAVTADLIKARLRFAEHAYAEIHLQGAHLTQWRDTQGRDNLFTSPSALYQPGVPIRGGNPIIFPQFGAGKMPQHGFARTAVWRVVETQATDAATVIVLALQANDVATAARTLWPYRFELRLTLTLAQTLTTQLQVKNADTQPFAFTFGFHTYLAVEAIEQARIEGLAGLVYRDNLAPSVRATETQKIVTIQSFTDRCYQTIPPELTLTDNSSGRKIVMQMTGCRDAFVWNPWEVAEQKLADLTAGSYRRFICLEPGQMQSAILLQENQSFTATQRLNRAD